MNIKARDNTMRILHYLGQKAITLAKAFELPLATVLEILSAGEPIFDYCSEHCDANEDYRALQNQDDRRLSYRERFGHEISRALNPKQKKLPVNRISDENGSKMLRDLREKKGWVR